MTEYEEQCMLVDWLDQLIAIGFDVKYTSIPNNTYTSSWSQKRKNKNSGLHKGLCDLFLIVKKKPLFIEMKKKKGGTLQPEQKAWIKAINETECLKAYVCKGFEEATDIIKEYLDK